MKALSHYASKFNLVALITAHECDAFKLRYKTSQGYLGYRLAPLATSGILRASMRRTKM